VVKIGCSLEPAARMKELQTGCPHKVVLEATTPGGHEREKELHRFFADDRVQGEWFRLTPMIETMIEAAKKAEAAEKPAVKPIHPPGFQPSRTERKLAAMFPPTKKVRAFNTNALNSEQRKRVATGDIHFPFRGKTYA
jgi:hypothetical protein